MTADQESRSPLETEPVQKLIVRYAIPTALTLMVNCLYNIVDQIFIANASYLGSYGNAANTVVFPLTVVALAIAAQNICLAAQELGLGAVWLGLFCCSLRRPRCSNFSI